MATTKNTKSKQAETAKDTVVEKLNQSPLKEKRQEYRLMWKYLVFAM